jgi:hypothetical protein
MQFSDLEFKTHPSGFGVQAKAVFANGYTASIVQNPFTYGGDEGLFELAIIRDGQLDYTTPITDDVIGRLSEDEVTEYLGKIEALETPNV